jgi:hypothetical protein
MADYAAVSGSLINNQKLETINQKPIPACKLFPAPHGEAGR